MTIYRAYVSSPPLILAKLIVYLARSLLDASAALPTDGRTSEIMVIQLNINVYAAALQ